MLFLQISLTTHCNLKCPYCPIEEYRNTAPKFPMSNMELIPFIHRCIASGSILPRDTIVELTGGEPALYDGLDELIKFLVARGFRTLVKTNGLLPIDKHDNVLRCAAFHELSNPPKYFDVMLIIEDTPDFEKKFSYCVDHSILFETIGKDKNNRLMDAHGFDTCSFINPAGHNCKCQDDKPIEFIADETGIDYGRIPFMSELNVRGICRYCKAAFDAWCFLKYFDKPTNS